MASGKRGALSSALLSSRRERALSDTSAAASDSDDVILVSKGAASATAFRRARAYAIDDSPSLAPLAVAEPVPEAPEAKPPRVPVSAPLRLAMRAGMAAACAFILTCTAAIFLTAPHSTPKDSIAVAEQPSAAPRETSTASFAPDKRESAVLDIAGLISRGNVYLSQGDIASARLYYQQAAEAGDGHAALLMGATFDPAFLRRAGAHGLRADPAQAIAWYRRARELGEADAAQLLVVLGAP